MSFFKDKNLTLTMLKSLHAIGKNDMTLIDFEL